MSKTDDILVGSMERLVNGKLPLDTGETLAKIGHAKAMVDFAEDRIARRVGEEVFEKKLKDAQDKFMGS